MINNSFRIKGKVHIVELKIWHSLQSRV